MGHAQVYSGVNTWNLPDAHQATLPSSSTPTTRNATTIRPHQPNQKNPTPNPTVSLPFNRGMSTSRLKERRNGHPKIPATMWPHRSPESQSRAPRSPPSDWCHWLQPFAASAAPPRTPSPQRGRTEAQAPQSRERKRAVKPDPLQKDQSPRNTTRPQTQSRDNTTQRSMRE